MDVFVGTIQSFAFDYAPYEWLLCNGQTLPLNQYELLYALIGVRYGGNGSTNFMLPNLQCRTMIGQGSAMNFTPRVIGQALGAESATLIIDNLPAHTHAITSAATVTTAISLAATASNPVTTPTTNNAFLGASGTGSGSASIYSDQQGTSPVTLKGVTSNVTNTSTAAITGEGAPVSVMNPFLAINFSIAITGLFPSRD